MVSSLKPKMSSGTRVRRYLEEVDRVIDAYKGEVEKLRLEYKSVMEHISQQQEWLTNIEERIRELEK